MSALLRVPLPCQRSSEYRCGDRAPAIIGTSRVVSRFIEMSWCTIKLCLPFLILVLGAERRIAEPVLSGLLDILDSCNYNCVRIP